jgi:hypothetical protein
MNRPPHGGWTAPRTALSRIPKLKVATSQPGTRNWPPGATAPPGPRSGPSCHGRQGHPRPAYSRGRAPRPVGAPAYHRGMRASAPPAPARAPAWDILRALARAATVGLPAVAEPGPGVCGCCHGASARGFARCFQCCLHEEIAPGLLADVVAPVACAPKGSRLATDLWRYKSGRPGAQEAGETLLALLLVFLREEGPRVWRAGRDPHTRLCLRDAQRARAARPAPAPDAGAREPGPAMGGPAGPARRGHLGTRAGSGAVLRAGPSHRAGGAAPGRHLDLRRHRAVGRGGPQARGRPVGGGGRSPAATCRRPRARPARARAPGSARPAPLVNRLDR